MVKKLRLSQNEIIDYLKSFAEIGTIGDCEENLGEYYEPYLDEAYFYVNEQNGKYARCGTDYFHDLVKYSLVKNFKRNNRGLIYVERKIIIDLNKNPYNLRYKSIGECWTWKRGNANSYFSNHDENSSYSVIICGYVHPNSIDWAKTIALNFGDFSNEAEI